ncbi:Dihydroorotase [Wallemia ichthyophaga EXF-994]|uniref:dihydroorotase n=1 Tax=Wallemia ichthyophaga (strain EXF-994 / CBS 113033) TaxID=1299270 RepID=R9ABA1_WALI9|nr:Dihydroorotase [Wallemia ichthyophaga EXF-994]EOQ99329.1 Dihydroorotase [Wallemia ichthyophaga EXF-994]
MNSSDHIRVESPADFHCHLRQGDMASLVTPLVPAGGVETCLVMPNTQPPITSTDMAVNYRSQLESLAPEVQFVMTLYLSPALTPEEIHKAAENGVTGVKSYPRGVTTNSDGGIESYDVYYPVFQAMQDTGMVLNLHGEVPSDEATGVTILNAEQRFLPQLDKLAHSFPNLRIVVEHATTKAAVEKVKSLPSNVGCSITPHHLELIVDDWAGQGFNYCKPVAKYWEDRAALRDVIREGHPRFFLGSDSAPHPRANKINKAPRLDEHLEAVPACACAAGLFTSAILIPLCAHLLESFGALDKLEGFVSKNGRAFYNIAPKTDKAVTLVKQDTTVPVEYTKSNGEGDSVVVPFMAGKTIKWQLL